MIGCRNKIERKKFIALLIKNKNKTCFLLGITIINQDVEIK
jgi:hypothetical protein